MPKRPWSWRQTWCDLLFAHWSVPAEALRPLVPAELAIDKCDGTAWIGVVPFRMQGVMLRWLPDVPGLSAFPELNVRTYVTCNGRPGVWFFSLDATRRLAVWGARRFFHLPYHLAEMQVTAGPSGIGYRSRRLDVARPVEFRARYEPISQPYEATAGTLEHWLTERYCLYARSPRGAIYRVEVHHHPWPLQRARVEIERNDLFAGLISPPLRAPPMLAHFARRVDVVVWSPERVEVQSMSKVPSLPHSGSLVGS
ncbi:MAG TPA: DUF2071 domain-containing protein [Pirellulales bacterium]|nr:DUF2071 domain-containing protein [Pirellulales bacterium]